MPNSKPPNWPLRIISSSAFALVLALVFESLSVTGKISFGFAKLCLWGAAVCVCIIAWTIAAKLTKEFYGRIVTVLLFAVVCGVLVPKIYEWEKVSQHPTKDPDAARQAKPPSLSTGTAEGKDHPPTTLGSGNSPSAHKRATPKTGFLTEKAPAPKTRRGTLAPSQIISAPNGIAIGGGTVTNPTVNNFAPPQRGVAAADRQQIVQFLAAHKARAIVNGPAGSEEGSRFAANLYDVLHAAGWDVGGIGQNLTATPVFVTNITEHGTPFSENSVVTVPEDDPANIIGHLLMASGAPHDNIKLARSLSVPEGTVVIDIGFRPQ